jgi:two-component system cell cycle sensor histidine kinase/response regulator CckA
METRKYHNSNSFNGKTRIALALLGIIPFLLVEYLFTFEKISLTNQFILFSAFALLSILAGFSLIRVSADQLANLARKIGEIIVGEKYDPLQFKVDEELNDIVSDFNIILRKSQQAQKDLKEQSVRLMQYAKALAENEQKYKTLTEESFIGVFIYQEERFVYINKRFAEIHGYRSDELLGSESFNLVYPEFMELTIQMAKDKMKGSSNVLRVELQKPKKDGDLFWCEVISSRIEYRGRPAIMGQLIDITERKQAEEEKNKLEAQLRQSQKMEAIGTLAGGVAHDFNNLLTIIIGNANLMLTDVDKDTHLRECIKEIEEAGERAASLTRQLLAFSHKQIIQPKVVDLNELLSNIVKMLGRLLGEDVEILMIPESPLWHVKVDPGQIEQVIMNLVINARDAMPKGGKLTIETANVDLDSNYFRKHGIKEKQSDNYVMLAVSDTGSGMDKETQEHIFEPFFTTKKPGKGTGLGLSTVYGIVKQNNGFVWVYSEPGQGSTFKIYLPKAKGDTVEEEKGLTHVVELGGSETVLIVEDDDSLRNFVRKALPQYGYRVLTAENGEDALRISKEYEGSIDLMVTDMIMPKMSGKETAEWMQSLYPQMQVIYMSGYTDNTIVQKGILAPGLDFIEKPFSSEGLARKVREVLDKRQD